MADGTKIEWTDATVNAVNGCTVVSPGCKHCYAMKQAHRFPARQGLTVKTAGGMVWTGEVRFNDKQLVLPLSWKRPRKIFWNAHGDLFHEDVPIEWIDKVFAVCAATPQHSHQILTKRSARMREYVTALPFRDNAVIRDSARACGLTLSACRDVSEALRSPLPNVWLGVSVEDQKRAEERIPDLLATPAAVRWLSCEPLIEELRLRAITTLRFRGAEILDALTGKLEGMFGDYCPTRLPKLDWIVAGGESGPGARALHPNWVRRLRDDCAATNTAFLMKQWGEYLPAGHPAMPTPTSLLQPWRYSHFPDGQMMVKVGKKAAGRMLDGVEHNGYPA